MKRKNDEVLCNKYIHILHETHTKEKASDWNLDDENCSCSYCKGNHKLHYGLNIPINKSWNSWFVIKYWNHRYIRWTNRFLKFI
jgi:hypothetical protein